MRKIAYKIKKLFANAAYVLFVILLIGAASVATALLSLLAIVVGIPVLAILDAFTTHERVADLLIEYEGAFIQGMAEGLQELATKLQD